MIFGIRPPYVVSGVMTLLVAAPGRASEPVRFEYSAPAGCPNEPQFVERVRERSQHYRLATEGELARAFVVTVTVEEGGATSRVDFVDTDGSGAFRRVKGSTCEEAVSGIALVCALAIDGRAVPEESLASIAATAEPSPAATPPPAVPPLTIADSGPHPPATSASNARSSLSFSAGLGAGYASHKGPSGAPTVDAFFDAGLSDVGPSARLSAFHFWSDATTSSGREARFRGYGLRLEVCPLAFGSARLFAEPCLGTDAGVLSASAVESAAVPDPRSDTQGWWDVLAIARVAGVLSGFLLLEAQGELALPLVDYRYGFGDPPVESYVFEVPPVGVSARAAIGFRFR